MESSRRTLDTTMRTVSAPTVVIIAAGEGTRMRSALPKVLHPLCGRPLILWPVSAAEEAGAGKIVVVDNPKRRLEDRLPEGVEVAIQPEPNGTGGAVQAAATHIDPDSTVVILAGDVPLITAEAIDALVKAHEDSEAQATMATMELDDPGQYGRVIRDETGNVEKRRRGEGRRGGRDARAARDPRGQHRDLRVRRQGAARRARQAHARQRAGRAVPPGRVAAARDDPGPPDRGPDAHARRQRPRPARPRSASSRSTASTTRSSAKA